MKRQLAPNIEIVIQHGDALRVAADVLALKYANALYGADRAAVHAIEESGSVIRDRLPKPSGFYFGSANGAIAAKNVLFVGVGPLRQFGYKEIRAFSRKVLEALAGEAPNVEHVVLTIHGPGYGLDEAEAFASEVAGLADAVGSRDFPVALRKITIVEANAGRTKRLRTLFDQLFLRVEGHTSDKPTFASANYQAREQLRSVGYDSDSKPHVFVAMPFAEEMDDVYHYGIQGAVKVSGFLCERADLSSFTGDVVEWVKNRVASASLVIADLSDANPNVYLEVGYAWGCGKPTVLLVKDTSHLKFDVRGQRCLVYKKIKDLEASLRTELKNLKGVSR
jgi:hypothetical protein